MIKPDNPKNNKNTFPIFTFTLTLSLTLFHYLIEKQDHHRRSSFLSIQSNSIHFNSFIFFILMPSIWKSEGKLCRLWLFRISQSRGKKIWFLMRLKRQHEIIKKFAQNTKKTGTEMAE